MAHFFGGHWFERCSCCQPPQTAHVASQTIGGNVVWPECECAYCKGLRQVKHAMEAAKREPDRRSRETQ